MSAILRHQLRLNGVTTDEESDKDLFASDVSLKEKEKKIEYRKSSANEEEFR